MRTKSKYREINSENTPAEKELPVEAVIAPPEAPAVAVAIEKPQAEPQATKADDPALALSKQLDELKRSEEIQRASQVALQQQSMSREQRLALWRQRGLSEAEASFLQRNPAMIDFPEITTLAANDAMAAGHERDSAPYWSALKMNFDNHLSRLREQSAAAANPATETTPEFFRPPPPSAPPTRSNIVSAPVSRSVPGSNIERDLNPKQMTLSAEELAIAKASNISAADYARGKLQLLREKARGERQ
jgi:hypothetical protein